LKAKASTGFFQLRGRNPKVEQNSIDLANATDSKVLLQIRKMTVQKDHTVAESCEPFATGFDGHCIAIKPNKSAVRTARIKNLLCMPTVPHRTVKIDSATLLNKPKQHFFWHNRKMLRGLHKLQSTKLTHFLPPSAQYTLTQRLVNRKFMYL